MLKKFQKSLVILFSFYLFSSILYAKINIITSVYPLKLILEEIVPSNFTIENVIPVNSNPHLYEPTPSAIKKIEKANIFIGVQEDFDGWITKNLKENTIKIFLNKKKSNPHIWLSPSLVIKKVDIISCTLVKTYPDFSKKIKINTEKFKNKLKKIIIEYKDKFRNLKNKNILEIHPAFDYLARDFSLKISGTIFNNEHLAISFKHYLTILKKAKKDKVKLILVSSNIYSKIVGNLAKDLNAKIITIDPLGKNEKSYTEYIKKILKKIYLGLLSIQ